MTHREGKCLDIYTEISENFIQEVVRKPLTMFKRLSLRRKEINIF